MSKKNNLALLMGMMSISGVSGAFAQNNRRQIGKTDEIKKIESEYQRAKRLGLKAWIIDGKLIYSATKKKALKITNKTKYL